MNADQLRVLVDFAFYFGTNAPFYFVGGWFIGKRSPAGTLFFLGPLPTQLVIAAGFPTSSGLAFPWWVNATIYTSILAGWTMAYVGYRLAKRPPPEPKDVPSQASLTAQFGLRGGL